MIADDVPDARLNEFDKDEWRDVTRLLRSDWTDEEYERAWDEFVALKREHERQRGLN